MTPARRSENLRPRAFAVELARMRWISSMLGAVSLGLWACGASTRAPTPAAPAAASASALPSTPAKTPDHTLVRSAVRAAVAKGLGAFLQHVDLEDRPVRVDGKFLGFRIAALRDEPFWSGVDLQPGDVVTRINGMPIERPEQAQAAFESLQSASELRVSCERGGVSRELVYTIVDDHR
jgi:type II secretory pathway component PulC